MKRLYGVFALLSLLVSISVSKASSVLPLSLDEHVRDANAVFRGTVVGMSSFKDADGLIYTRTSLRVDEALKGKFPAVVLTVHRGGTVKNRDDFYGLSPRFKFGQQYLVFVVRGAIGRLSCVQGQASAILLQPGKSSDGLAPASQAL